MKIKHINPLICTGKPEVILAMYVKDMGFQITHNLEFEKVNLLVLENGENRVDVVVDANPKKKSLFKKDFYAVRMQVEDFALSKKKLLAAGCKEVIDQVELKSARFALLEQPTGLMIGLMEHKKKAEQNVF